jgi:hypothetical protein
MSLCTPLTQRSGRKTPLFLTLALDVGQMQIQAMAVLSQYPLSRGLGGPQSKSVHDGQRKIPCPDSTEATFTQSFNP